MTSLTLTWRTMQDNHVCKICQDLEGFSWQFTIGADQFPNELIHPKYGVVWNSTLGPITHGHGQFMHCRCTLQFEFDFKDLLTKVQTLHNMVASLMEKKEAS